MQGSRGHLDPFHETIDLNQGSFSNDADMDGVASWDDRLNPVENRLSSYMVAPSDGNTSCTSTANDRAQSNSVWDHGESSSSGNNVQEQANYDDWRVRSGWLFGTDAPSEDWSLEPSDIGSTSYVGNRVTERSMNVPSYSTNHGSLDLSLNIEHARENNCCRGLEAGLPHTLHKCDHLGMRQFPSFYASSTNLGTSSGGSNNNASGPSCMRKVLEGTAGQFYPSGSSNSNQSIENIMHHSASGNLSMPPGPPALSLTNQLQQQNPRGRTGTSSVTRGPFPSSHVPGIVEDPTMNFNLRSNIGHHESVPFASARHSSAYSAQEHSQMISTNNTSELVSNIFNQPSIPVNEARYRYSYFWNGLSSSRHSRSSSSLMLSGERGSGSLDVNVRNSLRNNPEYPVIVSAPEGRNISQDPVHWRFTPGAPASSSNHSSGSGNGPRSSVCSSSTAWLLPNLSHTSENHQRLLERSPWIPFPSVLSGSQIQRIPFAVLPLAASSSDEIATTSRAQHQSGHRSAAYLRDMPGGAINGWNSLAAIQGRHRQIRQVLDAMRRGVHLQAEDHLRIDPFLNESAELHDRHRDMRLDVDNMSYEELLALEERIGNVSTGLSEKKIWDSLKHRKYEAVRTSPDLEPCCICQEDYATGDNVGKLDCGHEFHSGCIEQWLKQKNVCPICKMMALET